MLTLKELIDLKKRLVHEQISQDFAEKIFWDNYEEGKKSWHTADWKQRRKEIIKNECEICASNETLVLQHLSHPRKYKDYENEVIRKYNSLYKESSQLVDKHEFIDHVKQNFNYTPAPLCPRCNCRYPSERIRKKPRYLCKECRLEFDEPAHKTVEEIIEIYYVNPDATEVRSKCFISKNQWRNELNLRKIKYWLLREKAKNEYSEQIRKEAFLHYLDDNIKYLSFEDTITACKKCAFNFDFNNMELCPKCRKHYKGIRYPTCIKCLPEEQQKAISERVEFEKSMQAMEKDIGLD